MQDTFTDDVIDEIDRESKPAAKPECSATAWPRPGGHCCTGSRARHRSPRLPELPKPPNRPRKSARDPIRLKPRRRKRLDGKPRRSVFTEPTTCVPLPPVTGGHPYFLKLSNGKVNEMVKVISLPVPASQDAEDHARADTQRNQRLFDWADAVLKRLRLDKAVAAARSIEELRRVTLNADSAEVALAIRDALHPASGHRQEHFRGLKEGGLKLILKNRFAELKKTREAALRRRKQPDWTDRLILNKDGKIIANLANLILILREAPKWKGVLAYDEFNVRVVIRQRPPWGEEVADTPWTDHHESLARVWFQSEKISPSAGDVGRAVQAAARHNPFHPVRDYFNSLVWDGVPRLDSWLNRYFHVEDSEYIRAIGPRYLISSVARIFQPGARSTTCSCSKVRRASKNRKRCGHWPKNDSWFTDRLSHVASKDAALEIAGVLIVEIAEMDALTKATSSAIKSFLTRRRDRFRPPYGKHPINLPRQCVFAATINPTARRLFEGSHRCAADSGRLLAAA